MDEAERLCDRVAIIDHGKLIALDTPGGLIASLGGDEIVEFTCTSADGQSPADATVFASLPSVSSARLENGGVCLAVRELYVALPALVDMLESRGFRLTSLTTRKASLEDVFVQL